MTQKVEDYFITPLEAHFESQPTEGQRETILEDMEPFSEEALNDAVEWLKRSRQSAKTFPSPKECNKAITAVTTIIAATSDLTKPQMASGMTYGQMLAVWVAQKRGAVIINRGSMEWDEWHTYFRSIDQKFQLDMMREESLKAWTVPTRLPQEFDARAR